MGNVSNHFRETSNSGISSEHLNVEEEFNLCCFLASGYSQCLLIHSNFKKLVLTAILGTLNLQGAAQQSSPSPQGQLFDPHTRSRKIYRFLTTFLQNIQHHVWHWRKKLLKTSNAIHVVITVAFSLRTLAGRLTAGVSAKTRACDHNWPFFQYFSMESKSGPGSLKVTICFTNFPYALRDYEL